MAGARKDDLMIVSRDGKDFRATVEKMQLPISEFPELPEVVKAGWDLIEVDEAAGAVYQVQGGAVYHEGVYYQGMMRGEGPFVVLIFKSTDGQSWTKVDQTGMDHPGSGWLSHKGYIYCSRTGCGRKKVLKSTDASIWEEITADLDEPQLWSNGDVMLATFIERGGYYAIQISTDDGETFENCDVPAGLQGKKVFPAYGDGYWLGVTDADPGAQVVKSSDGKTWEAVADVSGFADREPLGIVYGAGKFVMVAKDDSIRYSTDGQVWELADTSAIEGDIVIPGSPYRPTKITYVDCFGFISMSEGRDKVFSLQSSDGVKWFSNPLDDGASFLGFAGSCDGVVIHHEVDSSDGKPIGSWTEKLDFTKPGGGTDPEPEVPVEPEVPEAPDAPDLVGATTFIEKGEGFVKFTDDGKFNIQNNLSSNTGWNANCNTGLVELVNIPEGALFCCPCYNEVRNGFDIDKTNSFTAENWAGSASFEVKIGGQTIIKMTDWFLNQVGHGYHNYAFNMPAEPVKGRLSVSASWSRVHGKIEGEVKLPIYVQPPGVNAEFLYKEGDANKIMNEWVQGDHNEGDLFLVTVGGEDGMHGTESQWGGDIIVYDSPGKIKSKTGDVIELPETFRSQDFCEVHFHRLDEKGLIAVGFTPVTDCLAWVKA